jgi:hypothetical protein
MHARCYRTTVLFTHVSHMYAASVTQYALFMLNRDPVYPAVLAWALSAVADERGWSKMKTYVKPSQLEAQRVAAKVGSIVMIITALAPLIAQAVSAL